MELILANFAGTARRETLNSKEYLVVPLTMIVHGVLSGSNGPLYYPQEELADGSIWNHMPIVVRHPYKHGRPTSARQPEILNKTGIGFIFEAKPSSSGEALIAEGWFDVEATKRIHPGIYNDLEAGRQLELSTGLQADYEKAPNGALFNGTAYRYIVRNMRPDHLAVLPDQVGACSLTMGCGVNVTTNAANVKEGYSVELVDELDKYFISNLSEGEGFERVLGDDGKQRYKIWKKKDTLNQDDKTSIWQKLGTLLGITNSKVPEPDSQSGLSTTNNEEPDMAKLTENDRPKLIKELTTNCDCWDAKKDAETLKAIPLDKLAQLVNHSVEEAANRELAESVKEGVTDTAGAKLSFNTETGKWEAEKEEKPAAKTTTNKNNSNDQDDNASRLTPEEQEDLKWARNERAKKRTRLITKLVANFDPDDRAERAKKLNKKTLSELEELVEFALNAGPDDDEEDDDGEEYQPSRVSGRKSKPGRYAGAGRVANSDDSDDDDMTNNILLPPTLDFGDMTGELRKKLEAARSAS